MGPFLVVDAVSNGQEKMQRTNDDFVARGEFNFSFGLLAVDKRAIAAAEIFDRNRGAVTRNEAVLPTDSGATSAEMAFGASANQELVFLDGNFGAVFGAFQHFENHIHSRYYESRPMSQSRERSPPQGRLRTADAPALLASSKTGSPVRRDVRQFHNITRFAKKIAKLATFRMEFYPLKPHQVPLA